MDNAKMNHKLSIIIPCYNESENLPFLISKLKKVANSNIEIILVDNGSTDTTASILIEQLRDAKYITSTNVKLNSGYGNGILEGLAVAKGDFLGWMHADLQTDPRDVIAAFQLLEKNYFRPKIFIKGLRKGRPIVDVFFTFGMSVFASILFRSLFWDINAQPNIFHRSEFEKWLNPPKDFSLDLFAYYSLITNKCEVHRIKVNFPKRLYGKSSWNSGLKSKVNFILRTIRFCIQLRKDKK